MKLTCPHCKKDIEIESKNNLKLRLNQLNTKFIQWPYDIQDEAHKQELIELAKEIQQVCQKLKLYSNET